MRSPRVLLGFDYFVRYTAALAEGMLANGWHPGLAYRIHDHAFGLTPGGLERYLAANADARVDLLPLSGRARELAALRMAIRAGRQRRAWEADVVHVQQCIANDPRILMTVPLGRSSFALTIHDVVLHPGDPTPPWHKRQLLRLLLHHAGLVFVHAEQLREDLQRDWHVRAPVVVVPHGVDRAHPTPLPERPQVLFFGRISRYKGLDLLLDAMPAVWERHPGAGLTIAGEGGLPAHAVLDDPRVTLVHRHVPDDEVAGLFQAASLVVLPYIEASQSGVGSLAKGHGRALLATDVGGLRELVADGSGRLVVAGDVAALAAGIAGLLADRAALEQLGAAGRRAVEEHAGWPCVAEMTIAAYERHLLGRSRDTISVPIAAGARERA